METADKSIIELISVSLDRIEFEKKSPRLRNHDIPAASIRIGVSIQWLTEMHSVTECNIAVYEGDDPKGDFRAKLTYHVEASTNDPSNHKDLRQFAKFGAAFNALVFARDVVIDLTAKSFGRAALLPLLDIRKLGPLVSFEGAEPSGKLDGPPPNRPVDPLH